MSLGLKSRWGLRLGAAANAAAVMLLLTPAMAKAQASATDVLAKGARAAAKLSSIHLRGQLRTLPADTFSNIDPDSNFATIELWQQFSPDSKWRVEKPGRVAVMDAQQTLLFITRGKLATKLPQPSPNGFDTEWLQGIANLGNTLSNELRHAQAQGWKLDLAEEAGVDGRRKFVISVKAKHGLPDDDYSKNKFFETADTRRVYRFDAQTERLELVRIYLPRNAGEVEVFALSQIDYNPPIDPRVWRLELPADVNWVKDPPKLPDSESYALMTAEQAARAFFEACGREDWTEVARYRTNITDRLKNVLGGLQILSLGEAFKTKSYRGQYVPYEIVLRPKEFHLRMSNTNSAKRFVVTGIFDSKLKLQQEMKWLAPPEVLPDNETYAGMSPGDAAKAYVAASAKCDWIEMRKFAPATEVNNSKRQIDEAKRQGIDVRNLMPIMEVGDAFWASEQAAYFVKCRMSSVKRQNLALRKDRPKSRWQVEGGI
jgi:hypothetical protein